MCEGIWNSYLGDDDDDDAAVTRDSQVHQAVLSELSKRGPESVVWAIRQLDHRAYEAREECAELLRTIAKSEGLGGHLARAVSALEKLALRPVEEDNKEAVAATTALYALDVIDGEACVRAARRVLTSPEWDDDDNQWTAAELIERHTGRSFMDSEDPVAAAKNWIAANP
jgi:hypothetical protein